MSNKLEELILYVAHKSHDDPKFGATKLNKILFWSDFLAYGYWGRPITGAQYVHRQRGPVPREVVEACSNLTHQGRAKLEERLYFGFPQKRIVPLVNPDLSLFSSDEIQLVTSVLQMLINENATEVSELTHRLRPWLDTVENEEIPYNSVFVIQEAPVTLDDKVWGIQKLQELQAAGVV